jgi:SAM-dependent methyltransferase
MQEPFVVPPTVPTPVTGEVPNLLIAPFEEWAARPEAFETASAWLDRVHEEMAGREDLHESMEALNRGLNALRQAFAPELWRRFCREVARKHPLRIFLHQCPFTRHGFERPRGYPGDAALIDFIYMDRAADELHAGREIYRYIHQQPSPRSVRERRVLLAREIDRTAQRVPQGSRILSVACGHLREVDLSRALAERQIGELIAFDQDPVSLAEVTRHQPPEIVKPVCGSIRALLTGKTTFSDMDFVYSAGLYDYLAENVATRLTALLFKMLRPGGQLLVANFAELPPEAGYMEAFMDWWLIYRDESQVEAFMGEVPQEQIGSMHLYRDSQQNVIYLSVTRR